MARAKVAPALKFNVPMTAGGIPLLALRLEEAAEALRISVRNLQDLIAADQIRTKRIGERRVVVPVEEVVRFLREV